MKAHQSQLIDLLVKTNAFRVGDFKLKSGGKSPYFVNFGHISAAADLQALGEVFATILVEDFGEDRFDAIVGPAYKGIPLAVATVLALKNKYGIGKDFIYDRKESKPHGADVGSVWGGRAPKPAERLVLIDDVFTSGETKVDLIRKIQNTTLGDQPAHVCALLVGVDRKQHAVSGGENMETFCLRFNLTPLVVLTIKELINQLAFSGELSEADRRRLDDYVREGSL